MEPLNRYIALMQERPELFRNTGKPDEVKIIKDPKRIHAEQDRIRAKLRAEGKPKNWIDIGVLAEDEWGYVVRDLVEFPDGRVIGWRRNINRKRIEGGTSAVIMPVQGDKVILLRHFRHETREWVWEFPRGFCEPDLTGEENAKKELVEEIGLFPQKITEVWRDLETVFFYAEMQDGKPPIQEDEAIQRIELIDVKELESWISTGKVTDWFTILTFLMAQKRKCFAV